MVVSKEVIKKLWHEGFFRQHRLMKDVKDVAFQRYRCTYSNWVMLLNRSKAFLRKEKNGWIQKNDPLMDSGITVVQVEANKPRTATRSFEEIIKDFTEEVSISDPYLTKDCLELLEKIKSNKINFLFNQIDKRVSQRDIIDFKKENSHIELRIFDKPYLHDRYILGSGKLLLIGHGLSLRNKETFMILLKSPLSQDLHSSLLEVFNRRWKEAKNI